MRIAVRPVEWKQKNVACGGGSPRIKEELRLRSKNEYAFRWRCHRFESLRKLRHLREEITGINLSHGFCGRVGKQERPKCYGRQNRQDHAKRCPAVPPRKSPPRFNCSNSFGADSRRQRERRKQLLKVMWKEISARARADKACDQPAGHKEEPLHSAGRDERNQTCCGKHPHDRLRSNECRKRTPAILEARRRSNGADVLQVVREHVVDELVQSAVSPKVKDD